LEDLDKFNAKSDFFNDICNTYTTENGLDKPLIDRRMNLLMIIKLYAKKIVNLKIMIIKLKKHNAPV